jgi:hypothetical protein
MIKDFNKYATEFDRPTECREHCVTNEKFVRELRLLDACNDVVCNDAVNERRVVSIQSEN